MSDLLDDALQVNVMSYEPVKRMLHEFFVANDLWFVGQDALIPDHDRSISIDACHFTRKGDEMMAQSFLDAIVVRDSIPEGRARAA